MTAQWQQNNSTTGTPPTPGGQPGRPARQEDNGTAPVASRLSREVAMANDTLNAFIGGKPRSWMLNENARVSGGATVPTAVRQQSGSLRLPKKPKNSAIPASKDPSPTESTSTFRQVPPIQTEKTAASTAEETNLRIASVDNIEAPPRPADAKDVNQGSIMPGGSREQPVDLCAGNSSGVGVESMLPSPAPSKSPPGPEHRQLQGHASQKRPGGDLDIGGPRPPKRTMSSSEATHPQPRRLSQIVQGVTGNSTNGGYPGETGAGRGNYVVVETALGPRTVFTPASSPLPSPSQPTFSGSTMSSQVPVNHDPGTKMKDTHALIIRLTNFARQQTAIGAPLSPSDRVRVRLLREAILKDDLVYLLVHQILCFVAVSSEEARRHANITTMHRKGMGFMRTFYPGHDQQTSSKTCLRFFSDFPWQFGSQNMQDLRIAAALKDARLFFSEGYQDIAKLQTMCCQRWYCPTDADVQTTLRFTSPVLVTLFGWTIRQMVTRKREALQEGVAQKEATQTVSGTAEAPATAAQSISINPLHQSLVLGSRSTPPLSVTFPNANGAQQSGGGYFQGLHGLHPRVANETSPPHTPLVNSPLETPVPAATLNQQYKQQLQNHPQQPPPQPVLGQHMQNNVEDFRLRLLQGSAQQQQQQQQQQQLLSQKQPQQQQQPQHLPLDTQNILPYQQQQQQRLQEQMQQLLQEQRQQQQQRQQLLLRQQQQRQPRGQQALSQQQPNSLYLSQLSHLSQLSQRQQRQPQQAQQAQPPHLSQNWYDNYPDQPQPPIEHLRHPLAVPPQGQQGPHQQQQQGLRQQRSWPRHGQQHAQSQVHNPAFQSSVSLQSGDTQPVFDAHPTIQAIAAIDTGAAHPRAQPLPLPQPSLRGTSLHQCPPLQENLLQLHLLSPKMELAPIAAASDPLHFSIIDFPVKRMELSSRCEKRVWQLPVDVEHRLARTRPAASLIDQPLRNNIDLGSLIYKLRCIEFKTKSGEPKPTDWVGKESIWPRNIFIEINGKRIEIRRKEAWGKDYPADITNYVQPGTNTVSIVHLNGNSAESIFYASVELHECTTESKLKSRIYEERYLDPIKAKTEIIRRVSSGSGNDNDDMIISSCTVVISVCCPLSFRLIGTPVRGRACAHLECFDFDNYMSSRHREKPGLPPKDDSYKCPHCNKRAKPEDLLVDGFLDDALKKLRADPTLCEDVASIVIDQNGDWQVKRRSEDVPVAIARQGLVGARQGSFGNVGPGSMVRRDSAVTAVRKQVEVICIDDD